MCRYKLELLTGTFHRKFLSCACTIRFTGNASKTLAQPSRPNIVLVLMDNFVWGELGSYGGGVIRGAATPRLDKLAREGMRLLNFNVEANVCLAGLR